MLNPGIAGRLDDMSKYTGAIHCRDAQGNLTTDCPDEWGRLGVYRVLFATSLFFAFMALLMTCVKSSRDPRASLQNGMWGIKLILLAGAMIGAFFIDNHFYAGWGWVALVGAFFFMIVQLILLVDFAHSWSESWVGKAEDGSKCHSFGLLAASAVMYIVSFIGTVLMFVYYTKAPGESCSLNKFFIGFNLALAVLCTAAALHPRVQEALPTSGILQSGVVILYTTYLTWSSVSDSPSVCSDIGGASTATIVLGAILTFVAVGYSALRTSSASQMGKLGMGGSDESSATLLDESTGDADDDDDGESGGQKIVDNERQSVIYSWTFFHLVFCVAALYITMVLTDWNVVSTDDTTGIAFGHDWSSVWVRMVSSWLVVILYLWTLVAPLVLSDRVFN